MKVVPFILGTAAIGLLTGASTAMADDCQRVLAVYASGVTPQTKTPLSKQNALALSRHEDGSCGWGVGNRQLTRAQAEAHALAHCRAFQGNKRCEIVGRNGSIVKSAEAENTSGTNQKELHALLHCAANVSNRAKNPDFDAAVVFSVAADKLTGERGTRGGKELYQGTIQPDGSIEIEGHGTSSGQAFHSNFSGQVNNSGQTVLKGQLAGDRFQRNCSMSFLDDSEQLRVRFGLAKTDGEQGPQAELATPSRAEAPKAAAPPGPLPRETRSQPAPEPQLPPASKESAATPAPQLSSPTSSHAAQIVHSHPEEAGTEKPNNPIGPLADDLAKQIALLQLIIGELQQDRQQNSTPPALTDQAIGALQEKLAEFKKRGSSQPENSPEYRTPVRPDDAQSFPTARYISETYWRIPYYIAGTPEVGDFWVLPQVSDAGQLEFKLRFIDPNSSTDKVRAEVKLSSSQAEQLADSLARLSAWSDTIHENRIRREFEKRVTCIPLSDCPPAGQRIEGKLSTELLFHINDEGETNGALRLNKGLYEETYNFSIKSGRLLWAYMVHVIKEAKLEYQAGSATNDDLDKILK